MKVFISWSGDESRAVATALRDWLPNVLQYVKPYVSSEDIDKGARWSTDISGELEESNFGILCVTQQNLHAPWVNFEAGALSKSLEHSRVSPFLFGIERAQVTGPLLQFQSTVHEREDVLKLIRSINKGAGELALTDARLEHIFGVWWDELAKTLDACVSLRVVPEEVAIQRDQSDLLSEVLELAREQQRILRTPELLMPPEYLQDLVRPRRQEIHPGLILELKGVEGFLSVLEADEDVDSDLADKASQAARDIRHAIKYLSTKVDPRRRRMLDAEDK